MPSYKLIKGTYTTKDGDKTTVHQQGATVEVDEETARTHPDIFEVDGGKEDSRLYPDDGTPHDKVDDRTKRARAEAIRREAATAPPPIDKDAANKPAAGTAQTLQTEQQRSENEKRGLFGGRRKGGEHGGEGT